MYEKFLALIVVFLLGVLLSRMLFSSGKNSECFVDCTPTVGPSDPIQAKVRHLEQTTAIGSISAFGGTQAPTGWAMCNGALVPVAGTYNELFKVIGKSFGGTGPSGQEPTHFNLPNLQGVFLRGVGGNSGKDPDVASRVVSAEGGNRGNAVGSYQENAVGTHTHGILETSGQNMNQTPNAGDARSRQRAFPDSVFGYVTESGTNWENTASIGWPRGTLIASETRPRNVAVNYIIRFA